MTATAQPTTTVAAELLARLRDHGITRVFGIVGREAEAILFDEVEGLDFVLTRHEFAAGVIADVLARLTGSLQVCFATLGPGMTNLATGVATSALDRSPVLALAAQIESADCFPTEAHQCLDNVAVMRSLTKYCAQLERPSDAAQMVDDAIDASCTEPVGPSFISLPIDALRAEVPSTKPRPLVNRSSESIRSDPDWLAKVRAVRNLLETAQHPVLLVGSAAIRSHAGVSIRALAERLGAPVITSYSAKGVLPEDHPLNYGPVTKYMDGILGIPALDQIFGPVDLVVGLGYDYAEALRPSLWARGAAKTFVRVATCANPVPARVQADIDVVADLPEFTSALVESVGDIDPKVPHDISAVRTRKSDLMRDDRVYGSGLAVHQVISAVNDVAAGQSTIVTDIGLYRHHAVLFSRADRPYAFLTSAGCSSFGYGLPAAIGAALADQGPRVYLIAGDGGFHSSSCDLETAVRLRLPITALVLTNQRNGLIELYQRVGHGRSHLVTTAFGPVDFVALAKANGGDGERAVSTEALRAALRRAQTADGPVVIEVPITYESELQAFEVIPE